MNLSWAPPSEIKQKKKHWKDHNIGWVGISTISGKKKLGKLKALKAVVVWEGRITSIEKMCRLNDKVLGIQCNDDTSKLSDQY